MTNDLSPAFEIKILNTILDVMDRVPYDPADQLTMLPGANVPNQLLGTVSEKISLKPADLKQFPGAPEQIDLSFDVITDRNDLQYHGEASINLWAHKKRIPGFNTPEGKIYKYNGNLEQGTYDGAFTAMLRELAKKSGLTSRFGIETTVGSKTGWFDMKSGSIADGLEGISLKFSDTNRAQLREAFVKRLNELGAQNVPDGPVVINHEARQRERTTTYKEKDRFL